MIELVSVFCLKAGGQTDNYSLLANFWATARVHDDVLLNGCKILWFLDLGALKKASYLLRGRKGETMSSFIFSIHYLCFHYIIVVVVFIIINNIIII